MTLPKLRAIRRRRSGRWGLLKGLRFLCESAHVYDSMGSCSLQAFGITVNAAWHRGVRPLSA
jgi:hypothetical protein